MWYSPSIKSSAILLLFVVGIMLPSNVFAALPIQSIHSHYLEGYANSGGGGTWIQTLGTGMRGTLEEIGIWYRRSGGAGTPSVTIKECSDYTYYSGCVDVGSGLLSSNNGVAEKISLIFSTPIVLNPLKYYAFIFDNNNGSGNTIRLYGSAADVYASGYATSSIQGNNGGDVSGMSDFFFELKGQQWSESLGFVGSYSPSSFEATSSPVFVSLVYYLDSLTQATEYFGVAWNYDTSSGFTTGNLTLPNTSTGVFLNATTSLVVPDGSWSVSWYLRDPENSLNTVGVPTEITFSVNSTNSVFLLPSMGGIQTTIASTSCNMNFLSTFDLADCVTFLLVPSSNIYGVYRSIPDLLMGKAPFSYIKSIQDTWKSLQLESGSTTAMLSLGDLGIGSTSPMGNFLPNVEFFSEEVITHFIPDFVFDAMKALMAAMLWITLFGDIYYTTRRELARAS